MIIMNEPVINCNQMEYTIKEMRNKVDSKTGYAFIDKEGNCIRIVYGEANKNMITRLLNKL